ncbi:MAG: NAD-dependent epimerase/dehydratase family protein [Bdellovibrionales bacterium]|nr:NAD-dependent epimerase/dehydratase family protein [Bdellovibrionales bacterium]
MKFLVTGGAGFIGSHFCDRALAEGHNVVAYDDLSTGKMLFLEDAKKNPKFEFVKGDIRDFEQTSTVMRAQKPDWVAHFAANADVRLGLERPRRDLDYNTMGTWNVAESARLAGTKNILFSSTGSVYGEPEVFPTPENAPFPVQTSLYAASKLAGEAILSSYALGYQMNAVVFRFVSILGPRYTHGHVFDFIKSLLKDSSALKVLGNGLQTKSYLHVTDLMNGLWTVINSQPKGFKVLNIGHDDALTVNRSIGYISKHMGVEPKLNYTGGERGWIGDSPRIQLDTAQLKSLGWSAKRSLEESVHDTAKYLTQNQNLME